MTQFGRVLSELNIEILCANSSQAKGCVERANRTLQDRLVKELRLAGISDMEAGNAFLPEFMMRYNAKFSKLPARSDNMHKPLNITDDRLRDILCKREQRYVGAQLTFSFERKRIMLEDNNITRGLVGKYVDTYAFVDGRLDIRWRGLSLRYKMFDVDHVSHTAIVENKRLGEVLAFIKEQQEQMPQPKVKSNSQKNGYQPNGRKPGRRTNFINDPTAITRSAQSLSRAGSNE
ncbi:ISNCY family transposase ISRel26 [Paenochrobactrum sp. BZR 201-1]